MSTGAKISLVAVGIFITIGLIDVAQEQGVGFVIAGILGWVFIISVIARN